MSFDFNVASVKPVIREAASMNNDGGGGNLGYMAQGKKEENKEKFYLSDESIFAKNEGSDAFGFGKEPVMQDEKFSLINWIKKIINKFRKIFA